MECIFLLSVARVADEPQLVQVDADRGTCFFEGIWKMAHVVMCDKLLILPRECHVVCLCGNVTSWSRCLIWRSYCCFELQSGNITSWSRCLIWRFHCRFKTLTIENSLKIFKKLVFWIWYNVDIPGGWTVILPNVLSKQLVVITVGLMSLTLFLVDLSSSFWY